MQTVPFLIFLAVPIFAALVIDTEAFVPFLILFFAIAGLSASHPSYDGSDEFQADVSERERLRELDADRPLRQADAVSAHRHRPTRPMTTAQV
jgi:hypothetical protein